MDDKNLPEWLSRLKRANGTEDEPNTDESVNYFNIGKIESDKPKTISEIINARLSELDDDDEDIDDDEIFDVAIAKPPQKRTALRRILDERKSETLYIKCNVDGDPVIRSHKDLLQYGDWLIKKLFESDSGMIRVDKSKSSRKIMSRRKVLVYDIDPVCVALYCIAFDGFEEHILRVTVDDAYRTELTEEQDDETAKAVFKLYCRSSD